MFDSYTQTLQDQIGQLSKLLGAQPAIAAPEVQPTQMSGANRFDCVDGVDGARAFLQKMPASSKHIVWDSQKDVFYGLEKDANGNAARLKICPYQVTFEPTMEEKYVTREDFNLLVTKLDSLLSKEVTDNG